MPQCKIKVVQSLNISTRRYPKENNITIAIVNPYHVKQSKELDDNLQTKNDSKDLKVIAKLVIDGRYSFPYIPEGIYGELRVADKLKNDITQQIISIKNKIHRWLSIYFPEYEKIYSSIDSKSGFLLLKETPLPKDIVELGSEGIVERWKQTKLRAVGLDKAKKLEEAAKKSIGCKNITSSARFEIKLLIEDYEYKQNQLNSITEELNKLCEKIPMIKEIAEIKGIGIATAISFVAEVGDIRRFKSAKQVQKYAGLALKENSSGKHKGLTRISKRGRKKLRTILFRATIPLIGFNKEFSSIYNYYIERKDNPLKKKQALTAICCKMIRIFFTILSKGIKYDETKMLHDIKRPVAA
ncbi:IS110 family transposase [Fusobacterium mortiferum]|nr:IS110 family transposase [Fusobacterium mortiferum]